MCLLFHDFYYFVLFILQFEYSVTAGTTVELRVPYQLAVQATNNSVIGVCTESVIYSDATTQSNTLTGCTYIESIQGFSAIYFTLPRSYSSLSKYMFSVGFIQNPSSAILNMDSFMITFTGNPSGSVSNGLTIVYEPNVIYDATLTQSSFQAGTTNNYVFKFKITNNIFRRGFIRLTFPQNVWTVSYLQNILSLTSINIYGTTRTGFSVLSPISEDITYSQLFELSQLVADSTKYITITLTGIKNPTKLQTYPSFEITTLDDEQNPIDQVTSNLQVTINQPGTLDYNTPVITDRTVDTTATFQFTITPSVKYGTNGYIEIVVPSIMSVSSTPVCTPLTGLTVTSTSSCRAIDSQTIRFQRGLSSSLLVSIFQVSFSITGIVNPLGVLTTPPLSIYFKESDGSIVAQNLAGGSYTTVAGACTVTSAIRDPSVLQVSLTGAIYTLTFSCTHRIPTAGRIQLVFPDEQVAYSASTTCQDQTGKDLSCTLTQGTGTFTATIAASQICGSSQCPANQAITIRLINARNPGYINSPLTQSVQIYTNNFLSGSFVVIGQVTTNVFFTNNLTPGPLTSMSLTRTGSSLTGAVPIYTFAFTTTNALSNGAVFVVTFPTATAYYDSSLTISCRIGSTSRTCTSTALSSDSTQVSTVTISSACTTTTCAATTYSVQITNFDNPFSTIANANTAFTISTRLSASNGLVDQGTFSAAQLSLTPNALTVSLTAPTTPIVVGEVKPYTISIQNPNNQIPSSNNGGSLVITFPSTVVLQSNLCSAQTASVTLTCVASTADQKATITSSIDLAKGQTITVQFPNNVKNPPTGAQSPAFQISTLYLTGQIDASTSLRVTPDTFNNILNPSASRDVVLVNQAIQLTISFQTSNPIPVNSIIKFYIPTDQAVIDTSKTFAVTDATTGGSVSITSTLAGPSSGYITFTVKEWCSDDNSNGPCPASTYTSQIKIVGLKNPANARYPTNSIKIEIYTSNNEKIDAVSSNLYTLPNCNYGALTSVSVSRSSNVVGAATTMTITFEVPSNGDLTDGSGYVNIFFPVGFLYDKSSIAACTIKDATSSSAASTTTCTKTQVADPSGIGNYLSKIVIDMKCGTLYTCSGSKSYTLTISGFFNQFNTKSQSGKIISVSTQTGSGSNYELKNTLDLTIGTDITTAQMPDLVPNTITVNNLIRTITSVDASTVIQFNITLPTRLEKNGLIQVIVPNTQFVSDGSSFQFQQFSGSSYGSAQSLTVLSQSSSEIVFQIKEWCSGSNAFCADNTRLIFQITKGFKNYGQVSTPTNFFTITTTTDDSLYQVDRITNQQATPSLTPGAITVSAVTFSNTQAAVAGHYVDISLKFGATISSSNYILLTFSTEFIRSDAGTITCADATGGSETSKTCTVTDNSKVVQTIKIDGFCTSSCSGTSTYTLRIKNIVNRLYVDAFSGTMLIETRVDASTLISTLSYSLSSVTTLTPGILTGATVTRSQTTQGQTSSYTLQWTTPGYLIDDSSVQLSLPLNQINLATGQTAYAYSDGTSTLTFTPGTATSTYYLASANEWKCSGGNCAPSTSFTLVITQSKNPFIQSTTYDDFIITHKTSDGKTIFVSPSPLTATPELEYGVIDGITITHQNSQYVSRNTEYVFAFTVQANIPQGGKLKFTFPDKRVLQSTTTLSCKVTGSTTTYPCTATYGTNGLSNIILTNICPSAECVAPLTYSLTLSGAMKNPATVYTISGNFLIESLSSANFIISQGKVANSLVTPILPEPITVTVNRTSPYMGADNDYRIAFEIVNPIASTGFVRLIIPTDQVTMPSAGPGCKVDFSLENLNCKVIYKNSVSFWIDIPCPCQGGCAAGTQINLLLIDTTNPSTFTANDVTSSWEVYTMNANKEYIDGLGTGLKAQPNLIGKTSIIQLLELDSEVVYKNTYFKIMIVPGSDFTTSAIFDVYFPDELFVKRSSTTCAVVLGTDRNFACTFTQYASGYIEKVSLSAPCPNQCSSDGSYIYKIPVQNRGDNYNPGGTFKVICRYEFIDVGMGTIGNYLQIIPDTITDLGIFNDGKDTIDDEARLYLSFYPINFVPPLASKGRIRVVVPSQIKIMSNKCTALISQNTFGTACSISGQTVIVTHSSQSIVSQNLTIQFQRILNPGSTRPTDPFLIYTERDYKSDGTYYQIDQNLINVTYNVTKLTPFLDISIKRYPMTSEQIGYQTGQPTQLLVAARLRHALESTACFIIVMPPAAQAMINPLASSATCYSTDSTGKQKNLLLCDINVTNGTITVRNYCQVSSCAFRTTAYFKLFEDFILNYNYVVAPLNASRDSVLVRSTTKEEYYYVDESPVIIKPDLEPTFLILPSPEIIRTNNVINRKVSWVISFKTNKNPVPQGGYLVIQVPQDVLLTIKNSSIDVKNYDSGKLYSNFTSFVYPDGKSVKNITIWDFCNSTLGCQVGQSYSIMIDWIKNPLSQLDDINSSVIIETRTKEGYAAERGTTPMVYKLFSQLIPIQIQNIFIRPVNPVPKVLTNYEITFSLDADLVITDKIIIQFPSELNPWPVVTTTRSLQASSSKCKNIFSNRALNCTKISSQSIEVTGLFTNTNNQYSIQIVDVMNADATGTTSGFIIDIINSRNLTIASRSTNSRVDILAKIDDQTTCNKVCGSCAGTTATCTSCKVPSKYPLFREYGCVDACGKGYFFDRTNLQCFKCHHSCEECFGPGNAQCNRCSQGYFKEDGQCVPYCTKNLEEDSNLRECKIKNQTQCSSNCKTCSYNRSFCLSCNQNSSTPILDTVLGKCIANDKKLCNNSISDRYYIDQDTKTCKTCNELCKTCDGISTRCYSCWEFQTRNIVNELYETCVDTCGLGSWYKKDDNICAYCNPVCLTCKGYGADECTVCNKTPEARQLYLFEGQCLIDCPEKYYVDTIVNECRQGEAQILSFSFLFMFASVFLGIVVVSLSIIITRNKNKTLDIIYAITSAVEFVNRFCLLGNLWVKTNVFALAVCFMNLIATCAIAVFFNFLFMSPIYAHSPHFRSLYKQFRITYQAVTAISYFVGVNMMRLLCSNLLNVEALRSNLSDFKFFLVPLNTMSNFTLIFTLCQTGLCVYVVLSMTVSDDAFILAILGLFTNFIMITLQFFKHLNTRAFLIRHS